MFNTVWDSHTSNNLHVWSTCHCGRINCSQNILAIISWLLVMDKLEMDSWTIWMNFEWDLNESRKLTSTSAVCQAVFTIHAIITYMTAMYGKFWWVTCVVRTVREVCRSSSNFPSLSKFPSSSHFPSSSNSSPSTQCFPIVIPSTFR